MDGYIELGVVIHDCNLSTWEMDAGIYGHPQLHIQFVISLSYMRHCTKILCC